VLAHFRFFFEYIRPEIRQYFIEADSEELPFSRAQRSIIYQRSKQAWTSVPSAPSSTSTSRTTSGSTIRSRRSTSRATTSASMSAVPAARKPYSASVFNISAMSFGALSANAILALNEGARRGHFFHDTGEGSISRYHRRTAATWSGKSAAATSAAAMPTGKFDGARFAENAASTR
jgi:hypothetical protein